MNAQVEARLEKYPEGIRAMFCRMRQLVFDSVSRGPEERIWAGMPSYYAGNAFVRLIPFRDHINIEARAVSACLGALAGYAVTPKGMLQVYAGQEIPEAALREIFAKTLEEQI